MTKIAKSPKKKLGRQPKKTPPPPTQEAQEDDGWGDVLEGEEGGEGEGDDVAQAAAAAPLPPPPPAFPPPPETATTPTTKEKEEQKMSEQQPQQQQTQQQQPPRETPTEVVNPAEMVGKVFSELGNAKSMDDMGKVFGGLMGQFMNPATAAGVQETLDINKLNRVDMLAFGQQIAQGFERAPVSLFADLERWKSGVMSQMSNAYLGTLACLGELLAPAFVLVPHPMGILIVNTQTGPVSAIGWEQLDVIKTRIRAQAQEVVRSFSAPPPQQRQQQNPFQQPQQPHPQQQPPFQQPPFQQPHPQQQQQAPFQQPRPQQQQNNGWGGGSL